MLHSSLEGPSCCHCAPRLAQAACRKRPPVRGNEGTVLVKAALVMFCGSPEGKLYLVHLSRGDPLRAAACETQHKHANAH